VVMAERHPAVRAIGVVSAAGGKEAVVRGSAADSAARLHVGHHANGTAHGRRAAAADELRNVDIGRARLRTPNTRMILVASACHLT